MEEHIHALRQLGINWAFLSQEFDETIGMLPVPVQTLIRVITTREQTELNSYLDSFEASECFYRDILGLSVELSRSEDPVQIKKGEIVTP